MKTDFQRHHLFFPVDKSFTGAECKIINRPPVIDETTNEILTYRLLIPPQKQTWRSSNYTRKYM